MSAFPSAMLNVCLSASAALFYKTLFVILLIPLRKLSQPSPQGNLRRKPEVTLQRSGIGISFLFSVICPFYYQIFSLRNHYQKSTGLSSHRLVRRKFTRSIVCTILRICEDLHEAVFWE